MQVQKFSTLPYTRPDYAAAQQKLRELTEQAEHAVGVKAALIPFKLRCVVLRHHDDAERIIYAGLQSRGVKRFQQIAVVVIEYEKVP